MEIGIGVRQGCCMSSILFKLRGVAEKYSDFLFTEVFIFIKHQCYPLQNSSLGQLHTDGDVVPNFGRSWKSAIGMVFSMSVKLF